MVITLGVIRAAFKKMAANNARGGLFISSLKDFGIDSLALYLNAEPDQLIPFLTELENSNEIYLYSGRTSKSKRQPILYIRVLE